MCLLFCSKVLKGSYYASVVIRPFINYIRLACCLLNTIMWSRSLSVLSVYGMINGHLQWDTITTASTVLQTSCSDLTKWWDTNLVVPVMTARVTYPIFSIQYGAIISHFLPNPHNRLSIAHPWEYGDMEWLLWVQSLIYTLLQSMWYCMKYRVILDWVNTLSPRQDGRLFPDDIFKCIFLNENVLMSIKISLKFVPKDQINNIPALV